MIRVPPLVVVGIPVLGVVGQVSGELELQTRMPGRNQVVIDLPVRRSDMALRADGRPDGEFLRIEKSQRLLARSLFPAGGIVLGPPLLCRPVATLTTYAVD
jgi:hypothetical protein